MKILLLELFLSLGLLCRVFQQRAMFFIICNFRILSCMKFQQERFLDSCSANALK